MAGSSRAVESGRAKPSGEACFVCAICQREQDLRWNPRGRDQARPPLCRYCEGEYTRGVGAPVGGSFADRRETLRVYALAEALHAEAARQKWAVSYAR